MKIGRNIFLFLTALLAATSSPRPARALSERLGALPPDIETLKGGALSGQDVD
jgi:hypothetical protein